MFELKSSPTPITDISPFVEMYAIGRKDSYKILRRKKGLYVKRYDKRHLLAVPSATLGELESVTGDKIESLSFKEFYLNGMLAIQRLPMEPKTRKTIESVLEIAKKLSSTDGLELAPKKFFDQLLAYLLQNNVLDAFFESVEMQGRTNTVARCILNMDYTIITTALSWISAIQVPMGWPELHNKFAAMGGQFYEEEEEAEEIYDDDDEIYDDDEEIYDDDEEHPF